MNGIRQHLFLGYAKTLGQALCKNPTYTTLPDDTRLSILINCCKVYIEELKKAKESSRNYGTKVNTKAIATNFIDYLINADWEEMVRKSKTAI